MPFPVMAAVGLGSALLKAFGGHKQKKAQQKQASAQQGAQFKQAQLDREARGKKFGVNEKSRIATLRSILAMAGNRGIKGIDINSLDPSLFEERPFTEAEVVAPPKETGRSTFGDILSGAGDVGLAGADFLGQKQAASKREAETAKLLCVLNPATCGQVGNTGVRGDTEGAVPGRA